MGTPFLEVDTISKSFGGLKAVSDVSFSMSRDEIIGLIGPNGAGKTTLLRLITGILKLDSGMIKFKGQKIVGMKTWDIVNLGIAGTFQNMRPFRRLPIIANVMVSCLSPRSMKRGEWVKKIEAKAMDALEFAGISDMALEKASTLSQGDLKRLEVARAIATEPELLLLDEPSLGLAPKIVQQIFEIIKDVNKEDGTTILLVEQNANLALQAASRGYVLETGSITLEDDAKKLLDNPEIRKAYLGE